VVRVCQKENFLRAEAQVDYVAVIRDGALQVAERVAAKSPEVAAEQLALRAWGTLDCRQLSLLLAANKLGVIVPPRGRKGQIGLRT
jgi:hypothetical protein